MRSELVADEIEQLIITLGSALSLDVLRSDRACMVELSYICTAFRQKDNKIKFLDVVSYYLINNYIL